MTPVPSRQPPEIMKTLDFRAKTAPIIVDAASRAA